MKKLRTNPFPGLRPFEADETQLFFGRDGQSVAIIEKLEVSHFVGVVGSSGSGKSSLVRAGLLPQLDGGLMACAGSNWRCAVMKPGDTPLRNLARQLAAEPVLGNGASDAFARALQIETVLRRGTQGLVQVAQQAALEPGDNLLVLVDQFEELFRMGGRAQPGAADEAAAFVALLLEAARQRALPIYVALTMRSDFLGDCARFRDLPEALNCSQYLVPRMSREELRSAIEGPVAVGGAAITPRLVQELLNVVGADQDQLPVLQHALMRTWDTWAQDGQFDVPLDLRHFERIGALKCALSAHADEVMAELNAHEKQIARRMFQRLSERGADAREIRRATHLGELCAVANPGPGMASQGGVSDPTLAERQRELVAVIDRFRARNRTFLTPAASVALEPESLVDIAHEALIRQWGTLKTWVEAEAESAALYGRLAGAAQRRDSPWRGPELHAALAWKSAQQPTQAWAQRYHAGLAAAMAFLERSRRASLVSNLLRSGLLVLLPLLVVLGLVTTKIYLDNRELDRLAGELTVTVGELQVQTEKLGANERVLLVNTEALKLQRDELKEKQGKLQGFADKLQAQNLELERLRIEANETAAVATTQSALASALGRDATASRLAAQSLLENDSETASLLAVEALKLARSTETEAAVWKALDRPAALPPLKLPGMRLVALSADGRRAVSIDRSRVLVYWDLEQGRELARTSLLHQKDSPALVISPSGERVFVGGEAPFLSAFEWRDGALQPLALPEGLPDKAVRRLQLSADGRLLASHTADGQLALLDVAAAPQLRHHLASGLATITELGFDGQGRWLAAVVSTAPRQVLVWDTVSGRELRKLTGMQTTPRLRFAQDALVVLKDGALTVYKGPAFGEQLEAGDPRNRELNNLFVSPKERYIFTTSRDGAVVIWTLDNNKLVGRSFVGAGRLGSQRGALPESSLVDAIAESADGNLVAFALQDGDFLARALRGSRTPPVVVIASPAAAAATTVFNLPRRSNRTMLGTLYTGNRVQQMQFSDGGDRLAIATNDEILRFDLADAGLRQKRARLPGNVPVEALLLGAGTVTARDAQNTVRRLDIASGRDAVLSEDAWQDNQRGTRPDAAALAPDGSGLALSAVLAPADGQTQRHLGLAWIGADGQRVDLPVAPLAKTEAAGPLEAVAAGGAGRRVAWAFHDAMRRALVIEVWDTTSRALAQTIVARGKVRALALSRDGQQLAAVLANPSGDEAAAAAPAAAGCGADGDVHVRVWRLAGSGASAQEPCWVLKGDDDDVYRLEFSASGQALLVANRSDAELHWLQLGGRTDARPPMRMVEGRAHALAPSQALLAVTDPARGLLLHDLARPGRPGLRLVGTDAGITTLAFSPGGQWLLGGALDGSIYVWNASDALPRARLRFGHRQPVTALAFDAAGQTLASVDRGGSVALWSLPALAAAPPMSAALCARVQRNLGFDAWRTYFKQVPYRRTCDGAPVGDGVAQGLLQEAWQAADSGQAAAVRMLVAEATTLTGDGQSAAALRDLCRRAAFSGAGKDALPLCERGAGAAGDARLAQLGRAIALAGTGQHAEAASELRAHMVRSNSDADARAMHEGWLRQLDARRNPFDASVLRTLRASG